MLRHRIAPGIYLSFFFSCFSFRFSFGVRCAFFCFSLLPLSLLPLSPMSVSPRLKLIYAGHGRSLFVLISDQSRASMIEYSSGVCEGQYKTPVPGSHAPRVILENTIVNNPTFFHFGFRQEKVPDGAEGRPGVLSGRCSRGRWMITSYREFRRPAHPEGLFCPRRPA